ncbi:L-threonylcarbamoyladenylate synthase [Sphingosinicella rhizophila]|uniref:Threonylcarbamoyl-AMP synthase n=1 Tax=Sphingosinicella rhizophila TaxID=3050082 RepID=A0ABU3Q4C6_9SPHN|nr:L-threonylcarbamoyladenylate synthase [Sphingosinicella sp. GR2756]MDT9598275.1 L-threonylcarbamoyladenylate synthase [Sphingosinicella sp. GR2756]
MTAQNPVFDTLVRPYGKAAIDEAAAIVADGWPVAVPTETVYGLAGDATSGQAIARIYAAKGRPSFNPLIVHVLSLDDAEKLAEFDSTALALAERFWPGPLTLVLPLRAGARIASLATAGLGTIALRSPVHPAMRGLLAATGRPLAAPSANASGLISPTRAEHVSASLGGSIKLIIDAGPTSLGLESTIVAISRGETRLLRPGPVTTEMLDIPLAPAGERGIEAPGQMSSHYAPSKQLRLDATERGEDEWLIGFGRVIGQSSLSPSGDLVEAASALFDRLHEAEAAPAQRIAVAPIPKEGLGIAINDRLARAAAPRGTC